MGNWADIVDFRVMVTPRLIQAFWFGASALCVLLGILMMINGNDTGLLSGFGLIIFGPLLIRVYCELLILFFKMYETLNDIAELLEEESDDTVVARSAAD